MKDSVTRFNFDDAFKALDEIEIPVAEKGIRANRVDLKESMKKVDKFELLFEDFYDVNNADDMNAVSEEREAEIAKAKLARIEKIVDLDAETEDDILPSYVGKTIIQCPQCMTLFYKNAEDIVRDEENPDVVNVAEVCQHCGNESGYDVIGKVAEETEAAPGDELGTEDFSAEVGDGMNDIAIDDGSENTEEAPAEEGGEIDELSAEADLDSLDLDTEFDLEEEPEEEEEANESLNTSKLLKKIKDKNELKTEHGSEKLTLNEENKRVVTKETDQLCSVIMDGNKDNEYFVGTEEECKAWIEKEKKTDAGRFRTWSVKKSAHVYVAESKENKRVVSKETDQLCSVIEDGNKDAEIFVGTEEECQAWIDKIKKTDAGKLRDRWSIKKSAHVPMLESIEDNLDDKLKAHEEYIKELRDTINELEKKLASTKNEQIKTSIQSRIDAARAELEAALPDAVKAEAETEELPDAAEAGIEDATDNTLDEIEETTESLHEAVESMTDTLNRAWEVAKKTNSPIGVTVVTPAGAGTTGKLKEWSRGVNANLYYVDAKNPDLMANGFDEDMISRPNTIIVIDEFDRAPAETQKAISDEVNYLDTQVEMVIVISNDSNINGDNFKRFKQYVAVVEKETATKSLTEDVSMTSSPENFKKLLGTKEFKEPISVDDVEEILSSYAESVQTQTVKGTVTDGDVIEQKTIDELADVTDVDEDSFDTSLTESLRSIYKNVKNFKMTDCSLTEAALTVEGVITFNSGKTKNTKYIFETAKLEPSNNKIYLEGVNTDLFKTGRIDVACNILSETLYAGDLKYKYHIGEELVKGIVKKKSNKLMEDTAATGMLTEAKEVTEVADKLANVVNAGNGKDKYKYLYLVPFLTPSMVNSNEKNTPTTYRQYPYVRGITQFDLGTSNEYNFIANTAPARKITKANKQIFSKINDKIAKLGTAIARDNGVKVDAATQKVAKQDLADDVSILAIWILASTQEIKAIDNKTIKPQELIKLVSAGVNNKDLTLLSIYYPKNKRLDTNLDGRGLDARAARALNILKADDNGVEADDFTIENEDPTETGPVVTDDKVGDGSGEPVEVKDDKAGGPPEDDMTLKIEDIRKFFEEKKDALANKRLVVLSLNTEKTHGLPIKVEKALQNEANLDKFDKCKGRATDLSTKYKDMNFTYGIFITELNAITEHKPYETKDFVCLATYNKGDEVLAKELPKIAAEEAPKI